MTSNLYDRRAAVGLLAVAAALGAGPTWAKADPVSDQVVRKLAAVVREKYVDAERAPAVAAELERRRRRGAYAGLGGAALAERLTADLRELTSDKHFAVFPPEEPSASPVGAPPPPQMSFSEIVKAQNFGVDRVERLRGNIGRIKLNSFPVLDADVEATYAAAMGVVRHTYGLVIDLTDNDGGDPSSLTHLMGYFVGGPHAVATLVWRDLPTEVFVTPATVPGPSYNAERPVILAVSGRTFSGGEAFAYHLRAFKRAVLVGEQTAGGANPGFGMPLGSGFFVFVPGGRTVSAVTRGNWDGLGMAPDVAAAGEAVAPVAYRTALERALALPGSPTRQGVLRGALEALT